MRRALLLCGHAMGHGSAPAENRSRIGGSDLHLMLALVKKKRGSENKRPPPQGRACKRLRLHRRYRYSAKLARPLPRRLPSESLSPLSPLSLPLP